MRQNWFTTALITVLAGMLGAAAFGVAGAENDTDSAPSDDGVTINVDQPSAAAGGSVAGGAGGGSVGGVGCAGGGGVAAAGVDGGGGGGAVAASANTNTLANAVDVENENVNINEQDQDQVLLSIPLDGFIGVPGVPTIP